jgi:1-acyl-sn-glycerol-3-phosphate acyltransferase
VIFPEGTRSKLSNDMLEFHGGSFRCALKAKCPIVPFALVDCYKAFDQKGSKPMKAQIHYLPTLPYEDYSHMKSGEVADLVKSRIAEAIAAHQ